MNKIKYLLAWLNDGRYLWLATGVITLALVFCLQPYSSEPKIRLTGLGLQLLGIATVIWGISETRSLFGHPSVLEKIFGWLKRFPLRRRSTIAAGANMSCSASIVSGRAYGTHGAGPDPTIESRIEALERNIEAVNNRISQTQSEIDNELRKVNDTIKEETHLRNSADSKLQEQLEATGTGGVHISAIGAAWLFVGVILSTAAIEISNFLK